MKKLSIEEVLYGKGLYARKSHGWQEKFVRDTLRGTKGVVDADIITGAYDLIAVLEARDMNDIFSRF